MRLSCLRTVLSCSIFAPAALRCLVSACLSASDTPCAGAGKSALVSTFAAVPFSGPAACVVGFGLFGLVAAVAIDRVVPFHPHASFGLANVLTMARAAGAALFAGLALEPGLLAGPHAWWALAGAALLLALDGLDGWLSRRQGTASAFGHRHAMRGWLGADIDHVGLTLAVEVSQGAGGRVGLGHGIRQHRETKALAS